MKSKAHLGDLGGDEEDDNINFNEDEEDEVIDDYKPRFNTEPRQDDQAYDNSFEVSEGRSGQDREPVKGERISARLRDRPVPTYQDEDDEDDEDDESDHAPRRHTRKRRASQRNSNSPRKKKQEVKSEDEPESQSAENENDNENENEMEQDEVDTGMANGRKEHSEREIMAAAKALALLNGRA